MTEAEWLACDDETQLLEFMRDRVTDRKLRLFASYCCRTFTDLLDSRCIFAVDIAERYAEGLASPQELEAARYAALEAFHEFDNRDGREMAADAVEGVCYLEDLQDYFGPAMWMASPVAANLLREMLGNPFRPVIVDPAWLTWNDGVVPKLAQVIYDERRFADLPILADALEDAGCADADILAHCRGGGEHVRGCWVVDLLLGKS
jgi:hypothetical protein